MVPKINKSHGPALLYSTTVAIIIPKLKGNKYAPA